MSSYIEVESRLYESFKPETKKISKVQIGNKLFDCEVILDLIPIEGSLSKKLVVCVDGILYERNTVIEKTNQGKKYDFSDLISISLRSIKTLKYEGDKNSFEEKFSIEYCLVPVFQYQNRLTRKRKIVYGCEYHRYQRTDFNYDINLIFWSMIGLTNKEIRKWLRTTNNTIKKKVNLFLHNLNTYLLILRLKEDSIIKESPVNSNLISNYKPIDFINKLYGTKFSLVSNQERVKTFFMIDPKNNFNLMTDLDLPNKLINNIEESLRWKALNTLIKIFYTDSFREDMYREFTEYFQFKKITWFLQVIYNDT